MTILLGKMMIDPKLIGFFLDKGAECQRWIAKPSPIASQVGASVVEPDGRLQKCR